jgi:hypothetical protein
MATPATALLLATLFVAGCATMGPAGVAPSATTTTAIQGWERYLRLDWTAAPRGAGNDIEGYVSSQYGQPITNVQLLAQGLDAGGNVVGQKLEWVRSPVPGLQSVYFKIPGMPAAATYRVSVWAFDTIESGPGDFM